MGNKIIMGIYKITNPNGKIYIGKSSNIKQRWNYYKRFKCENQPKLFNSLKKYGCEKHIFEIIEECNNQNINERERYWQDFYNVLDRDIGLNCILTKTDDKNVLYSKDTINKIKNSLSKFHSNKNKPIYQYTLDGNLIKIWKNYGEINDDGKYDKRYISLCCNGKVDKAYEFLWSFYEKEYDISFLNQVKITKSEKLSNNTFNLGRVLSEEHKNKISNSSKGRVLSECSKNKISKNNSKKILQLDLDGNTIREWNSATEVYNELNYRSQNISKVCNNKLKTAYGFKWVFSKQ